MGNMNYFENVNVQEKGISVVNIFMRLKISDNFVHSLLFMFNVQVKQPRKNKSFAYHFLYTNSLDTQRRLLKEHRVPISGIKLEFTIVLLRTLRFCFLLEHTAFSIT